MSDTPSTAGDGPDAAPKAPRRKNRIIAAPKAPRRKKLEITKYTIFQAGNLGKLENPGFRGAEGAAAKKSENHEIHYIINSEKFRISI